VGHVAQMGWMSNAYILVREYYETRPFERPRRSLKDNIKMKMAVFWDIAPCSLVDTDRHFRGTYCVHHQDDSQVQTRRREKLKSHTILKCILKKQCVRDGLD
jgi:hypothetical protein